ncbi:MAG: ATP synthase F1 subunit gamma [Bacteroidales bacterium]|nr:ATP synthase F1 subunit gamma [Bacteroidales bacterium]
MGYLNEIRSRINSVNSTRQITSAMKMVSSAKHHKAQNAIDRFSVYQQNLLMMLNDFMEYCEREDVKVDIPFSTQREVKKVAVVAVSSNMSLCGAFNENIAKELASTMEGYKSLGWENVQIYPIGLKIAKKAAAYPNVYWEVLNDMIKKPKYSETVKLTERLVELYSKGEIDRIELIYNHCKSSSKQIVLRETYLPVLSDDLKKMFQEGTKLIKGKYSSQFLLEPDPQTLINALIPKIIRLKLYAVLLDSAAAEQSARMMAMQIATDNADELLQSLRIQYNKQRQQAITNELLDIMGGTSLRDN